MPKRNLTLKSMLRNQENAGNLADFVGKILANLAVHYKYFGKIPIHPLAK